MFNQQLEFGRRKPPIVLQSEAAECGLACLAMVASHYGFRTDLPALRARFNVSLKGVNMPDLVNYAHQLQLVARPFALDTDELTQLKTPCILHWQFDHFVVLIKADRKRVVIHDPATGARTLTCDEVGPLFTGVALELMPGPEFKPVDERRRVQLQSLIGRVEGLWSGLAKVFAMAVALEVFGTVAPMLNQWVTDEALNAGDHDMLNAIAAGSLLLMVLQAALSQARGWTLMYLSTHLSMQWSAQIFTHLLRLPVEWFEKHHLGDVVSRFGAAGTIQKKLTSGFIGGILDGVMAVATFGLMVAYSGMMSMIVLVSVVLYMILRLVAYAPLREASMEAMMLGAQEQSCFLETVRAVQAIKLAGREVDRRTRWLNLSVESTNRSIRTQKLGLIFSNLHLLVSGIAGILLFRMGAGMVMDSHGAFTVGMLIAFTSYSGQFGARMRALIDNLIEFRMLSLNCERLADIVLEAPEPEGQDYAGIGDLPARIELVDVGFRYADNQPWVLRHVDLTIEPGESVALVGASGCGKTTLIKLILGTLTPSEGEIRYGGVPLAQLGTRAYRSVLGTVMQDDQLLAGSLRDNLTFFDDQPQLKRMETCARVAAIDQDIEKMPMRYDTLVGDMGAALSGGQRQRLLLARALYKGPKLLVLDEATSSLDVSLEQAVNAAVSRLSLTRIIVAHRPETIRSAGRVVPLVAGSIVQIPSTV